MTILANQNHWIILASQIWIFNIVISLFMEWTKHSLNELKMKTKNNRFSVTFNWFHPTWPKLTVPASVTKSKTLSPNPKQCCQKCGWTMICIKKVFNKVSIGIFKCDYKKQWKELRVEKGIIKSPKMVVDLFVLNQDRKFMKMVSKWHCDPWKWRNDQLSGKCWLVPLNWIFGFPPQQLFLSP